MTIAIDIAYGVIGVACTVLAARYVAPGITDAYRSGRSADVALYIKATFVLGGLAGCFTYLMISGFTS